MRDKDDLDLLLDSALSTYADPGPDSSIEQRVLTRIAAESAATPRPHWMPWAIALPVAACLLFVLTLQRTPQPQPGHTLETNRTAQPPSVATNTVPPAIQHHATLRRTKSHVNPEPPPSVEHAANAGPLPKREMFPSPQPLTPQERALVEFATQVPEPQRRAVVEAQMHDDALLGIADLHIPPIEPPDEGKN